MEAFELEEEIKKVSDRIESEKIQFEKNVFNLDGQIKAFTNWAWGFVIIGFIVTAFGIITYLCSSQEEYGLNLLGDFMSGTVASVWSLAGLFFIYVAFLGQKQQLLHQQLDIKYSQLQVMYTRLELAGQKTEMIEQNKTLRLQRFENTLFQMMGIHNEVIDKLSFKKSGGFSINVHETLEKREVIEQAVEDLKNFLRIPDSSNIEDAYTFLKIQYHHFYFSIYKQLLSHYFRNIYHIFKFIYTTNFITESEKKFYSSIVRAQLSSDEQYLILYNSLIPDLGYPNFLFLIRELDLLQNFDFNLISDFNFHKEIFNREVKNVKADFGKPFSNMASN